VTFKEDGSHIRLGNAAIVLNLSRKLVLQILKADTSVKDSIQFKLLRCAWNFHFALHVILSCPLSSLELLFVGDCPAVSTI